MWSLFTPHRALGNTILLTVVTAMSMIGLREFFDLMARARIAHSRGLGYIFGFLLSFGGFVVLCPAIGIRDAHDWTREIDLMIIAGATLGAMGISVFSEDIKTGIERVATTIFGLLYVPWMVSFMVKILFTQSIEGAHYLLFFLLVTKMGDVGAYTIGGALGKTKLMPKISPKKTWEGMFGAIGASTATAVAYRLAFADSMSEASVGAAAIVGVLLGVTGALGDLFASLFKRETGVKDSGQIVPGIGGMLDLIDSPLFNAPIMYFFIQFFVVAKP